MPRRFDFVSPGIQLTEVDQSQLPVTTTNEPGPLIVGRALAGPAMKPIRVNTLEDFNEVFGIGILGFALTEAVALFALVIALLLLYTF